MVLDRAVTSSNLSFYKMALDAGLRVGYKGMRAAVGIPAKHLLQ